MIKVRLTGPEDISYEQCEKLLEMDLSHLFELVTIPIKNLGSLKLECFKLGITWSNENNYLVLLKDKMRIAKFSVLGKWIQLNPKIVELEYGSRDQVFSLLEALPETFTIMLGNTPSDLSKLRNTLNLAPF